MLVLPVSLFDRHTLLRLEHTACVSNGFASQNLLLLISAPINRLELPHRLKQLVIKRFSMLPFFSVISVILCRQVHLICSSYEHYSSNVIPLNTFLCPCVKHIADRKKIKSSSELQCFSSVLLLSLLFFSCSLVN